MIYIDVRGPAPLEEVSAVLLALANAFPGSTASTSQLPPGVITRLEVHPGGKP